MSASRTGQDLGRYELRVRGLLGPLLLASLPHAAARRMPDHSVLITGSTSTRDVVELVRLIVGRGLEVDSVRTVTHVDRRGPRDEG
jgi:hypothetical protein